MILCIANVLTLDEIDAIAAQLHEAEFVDGKLTAGWHARLVKHNQQLKGSSESSQHLYGVISRALERNALFQMAARPKTIRQPLFSRYEVGMSYGTHVDNALMGKLDKIRTDLSFTIFLTSPDSYEGGELVIETTQGERAIKLDAGAMVLYPSSTLHRVDPVTTGVRLVAVSWVQSFIRDPHAREILFDLDTARRRLFDQSGKSPEFDLVSKSHANLLRMWAEV